VKSFLAKAAGLALAALVWGGFLQAQSFESAHWKAQIETAGSKTEAEIWKKGNRMRTRVQLMGTTWNTIFKEGDSRYHWQEGKTTGIRTPLGDAWSMSYVNKVDEVRAKGKKIGNETVDGHSCEIYESSASDQEYGGVGKHTYWLAKDLKNFPVKIVMETGGVKKIILNRKVDLSDTIPDSFLIPPSGVKFQDNPR
jgi:hypothetical protein